MITNEQDEYSKKRFSLLSFFILKISLSLSLSLNCGGVWCFFKDFLRRRLEKTENAKRRILDENNQSPPRCIFCVHPAALMNTTRFYHDDEEHKLFIKNI